MSLFKKLSEFSVCYSFNREDIQHAEMLHYSVLPSSFFQDFFQKSVLEKGSLRACEKAYFARKLKAVMDLNKALRGLLKRASSHPRNQKEGFATRLSELLSSQFTSNSCSECGGSYKSQQNSQHHQEGCLKRA